MRSCSSRKLRGAATIYCAIWRFENGTRVAELLPRVCREIVKS
jgi:hypothetical protein